MVILSLGTGMLALPKYMSHTSLFFSCLFIIGICIVVWWSLLLLSRACEKNRIYNYSKLIQHLYGKTLSIIYDTIVILYSFGVLILFNIIIYATLGEAIYGLYFYKKYETLEDFKNQSFWNEWYIQILLPYSVSIIVVYPMCLIKDVSKLRIISLIGVINILFLIFVVLFQSKDYITLNNIKKNVNYFDISQGLKDKFDALNFISTIFYASCFHIGCVPVINTLKNNVRRRINKAIRRTILLDILLYLTIAVIGYLSYPINTPSLIIQRPTLKIGDSDILMSLGKLGLVFTFFTKLPNTYSSLRITIFDKLFGTTEITNVKNYIITLLVIMLCVTCSILYTEISSYIKIMGGLFSTLVGFLFPSLLIVKSSRRKRYHWKNILTLGLFILLTLIGFISSGFTVRELIKGESD
jgi:amino acid permease